MVSDEKYISQKGVIEYGISDHNIISHLFMDDGVVVMADKAAARSSLERTICRRGRLMHQKSAEHEKSSVDEETLPASGGFGRFVWGLF